MSRLKRGREEKEKVKIMTTRGIPGTISDESMLQPLMFSTNTTYKQTIGGCTSSTMFKP